MEYGIKQLADLSGVSARTLRYYDEIGLLSPVRTSDSGYRYYGPKELSLLQQILFFKERGFELRTISDIIYNTEFDTLTALYEHLNDLEKQRDQMNEIISTVKKTILTMKGDYEMSDKEKFEAFKTKLVEDNEAKYGNEIREKYGDDTVSESNSKMLNMSKEEYDAFEHLSAVILAGLNRAVQEGKTYESEEAREIVENHKEWISKAWNKYNKDAHKGVAEMYVADERFTAFYDKETSGCAKLLRDAIHYWLDNEDM